MLEFFAIMGLLAAGVVLFHRLSVLERRLGELHEHIEWRVPQAAEIAALADSATVTVPPVKKPAVALRTAEHTVIVAPPEPSPRESSQAPDAEAPRQRFSLASFDFEELFGRRLPIWAGGVALAVAGIFLVRYSIERGLITPQIRVTMAFIFGLLLLAGAELAYRFEARVADPRVRQALAGAGLATLYAGFYLAGTQYGLIGQTLAFLGLAGVTAAAIALSFRFGLPSAVLGLVGGFAAPALVGGEQANVPLLALYLGLVTAGLTVSGRRQARPWMGIAALAGGLGWGALLLLSGDPGVAEILALGLYLVVLGSIVPVLAGADKFERPLRLGAALVASVQLALLVDQAGYALLAWGLYLLLASALAWFAWRKPELREGNAIAAVVGVLLFSQWSAPPPGQFAAVGFALAAIFAGAPLSLIARCEHRRIDLGQLALVPPALALVAYATFGDFDADRIEPLLALSASMLAALPLAGAWLLRASEERGWFAGLLGFGAALVFAALLMVSPGCSAPLAAAIVLAGPALILGKRRDEPLANLLWVGAAITVLALIVTPYFTPEADRSVGAVTDAPVFRAILRWLAAALPFAALAWIDPRKPMRRVAEAIAAVFVYALAAQIVPAAWLAWAAALLAIAIYFAEPERFAARLTLTAITAFWALEPLLQWLGPNLVSLAGDPVTIGELPNLKTVALRILPLLACAALPTGRLPDIAGHRINRGWVVAPLAIIALHIAYKQLFVIETVSDFVAYGMAERTVWQALLLGGAWLADRGGQLLGRSRTLAIVLAAAALAHFLIYTAGLHNPLWSRQAVGPTPLANWILAAHTVAILAAALLRRWLDARWRPAIDGLIMGIAALGALALLRQVFGGAIPADAPLGAAEDLLRSLFGILLALFFLWLGSWRGERSWRLGSLILMLLAVAKVFVFDTAGLEGLLRIASFMALGFSLIGIGWFYSRQLAGAAPPASMH